jgi:hypothetical protein
MRKFLPTLILAGTVALATLCEAGPRQPAPAPATSSLSPMEELCHMVGNTAHLSAQMRDKGLSYLEAVQLLREVSAKTPIPGPWGVWVNTSVFGNLRWVYEHPFTSAHQMRNDTELACLRIAEQNGITSATAIRDRY